MGFAGTLCQRVVVDVAGLRDFAGGHHERAVRIDLSSSNFVQQVLAAEFVGDASHRQPERSR